MKIHPSSQQDPAHLKISHLQAEVQSLKNTLIQTHETVKADFQQVCGKPGDDHSIREMALGIRHTLECILSTVPEHAYWVDKNNDSGNELCTSHNNTLPIYLHQQVLAPLVTFEQFAQLVGQDLLTALNGLCSQISKLPLPSEVTIEKANLDDMQAHITQLLDMLHNALETHTLTSHTPTKRQMFDFHDAMQQVFDNSSRLAKAQFTEFFSSIEANIPQRVIGDVDQMQQCLSLFLNIILKRIAHGHLRLDAELARPQDSEGKLIVRFIIEASSTNSTGQLLLNRNQLDTCQIPTNPQHHDIQAIAAAVEKMQGECHFNQSTQALTAVITLPLSMPLYKSASYLKQGDTEDWTCSEDGVSQSTACDYCSVDVENGNQTRNCESPSSSSDTSKLSPNCCNINLMRCKSGPKQDAEKA